MEKRYALGLDYGTLSVRAVLLDLATGRIAAEAACDYPHGVIEGHLPTGEPLPEGMALQDPADQLDVLPPLMRDLFSSGEGSVLPGEVAAIGIDVTACTLLPVDKDLIPLTEDPRFARDPHAYVKLWKSHSAQGWADRVNEVLRREDPELLGWYGGTVSSEWTLPKILETLDEDPTLYEAADSFLEVGDYVTGFLTGRTSPAISSCGAGYKALWRRPDPERIAKGLQDPTGYPSESILKAIDERLGGLLTTKLRHPVLPLGACAGRLSPKAASFLGLPEGILVSTFMVDAHASLLGSGITSPGELFLILGTSACSMICDENEYPLSGICGSVFGGILPGLFGYEAGQPAVGDTFGWFVDQLLSSELRQEAESRGISAHELLSEKASLLRPGESGLVALDWWNGNRSILDDSGLSGMILGLTTRTRPEEIYRALLESCAFGIRMIAENFRDGGIPIRKVLAGGSVSLKNPLFMQILSNVLDIEVSVPLVSQASARGAALMAAGLVTGRGANADQGTENKKADIPAKVYQPQENDIKIYEDLYGIYSELYRYFGKENASLMHRMKALRNP